MFPGTVRTSVRRSTLEHLSLFLNSAKPHILDEDASHAQGAGPIPTIALPHLRVAEIALCEDDADIFLSVLSHVRFSARCRIALRCGTRAPERGRAALLFPNDPELYPILRTAVQATWHGAHGFSCIGPGPNPGPREADERGEVESLHAASRLPSAATPSPAAPKTARPKANFGVDMRDRLRTWE